MFKRLWIVAIILATALPAFAQPDPLSGYSGRLQLTAPASLGTDTLTSIATPFAIGKGYLPGARPDCYDVRMQDAEGNELPMSIVKDGELIGAVQFVFLADSLFAGRRFYLNFDNDSVNSPPDDTGLWAEPYAAWSFEGYPSRGGNEPDLSGGGFDLVPTGTASWRDEHRVNGVLGSAWYFDEQRGATTPALNVTGEWTISAWVYLLTNSTDAIAMGNPWWYLIAAQASDAQDGPMAVFRYGTHNVQYNYDDCDASIGQWAKYDVVYTLSPDTTITFYKDGVACTSETVSLYGVGTDISAWYELGYNIDLLGEDNNGGTPIGIGQQAYAVDNNQQDAMNGFVDEYRVYDKALDATRISIETAMWSAPASWFDVGNVEPILSEPTNPVITRVSGQRTTATGAPPLVITGTGFGSRSIADSVWTGSMIEAATTDSIVYEIVAWSDWNQGGASNTGNYPHISTDKAWSGTKAIDASVDHTLDDNCLFAYTFPSGGNNRIYMSYWFWWEPTTAYGGEQFKHVRWVPEYQVSAFSDDSGQNILHWYSNSSLQAYSAGFPANCGINCDYAYEGNGYTSWNCFGHDVYSGIMDTPGGGTYAYAEKMIFGHNVINPGRWVRFEWEYENSSPELWDGYVKYTITDPTLGRTYVGAETRPGLFRQAALADSCDFANDYTTIKHIGFQNFFELADANNDEAVTTFYDDIWIQNGTLARVVLGDNSTWELCGKREELFPTSWSDTEIVVPYRANSIGDTETGYIYVVTDAKAVSNGVYVSVPASANNPNPNKKPDVEGGE